MKYLVKGFIGLCVLSMAIIAVSCASGDEAAGDKAYEMAKKTTGNVRLTQLKTAYTHYRNAVTKDPNNVSTRLRNRYIEMILERAQQLIEVSADMGAIPVLMEDIEEQLKDDVLPEVRQRYAAFIAQRGDSSKARDRFIDALRFYDDAIAKAVDPAPFQQKRNEVISGVASENFETARAEFAAARRETDEGEKVAGMIRAEYYAKVALYFDSTHTDAQKLLSDIYKENVGQYSAYKLHITDYTDTVMFKRINKHDIVMAITGNRGTQYDINMISATYNHLRMRSENFALIGLDGRKYQGDAGARMRPEILEFEKEGEYTVNFRGAPPMARIRKLVYENGPHYTEKYFQ